jgi:FkbM family methyltransferase
VSIFKKLIPYKLKRKIKEYLGVPSLHWSLQNLKRIGFDPAVIIDIGAYEGNWTLDVLEIYPNARILMLEAQKKKESILQKLREHRYNIDYIIALVSSTDGNEKLFGECETNSQVVESGQNGNDVYSLPTQTLDNILARAQFPYPDFLKLDVQGHELEVLKGAENALAHSEVCLLEMSLLDLGNKQPLLSKMVSFMDEKGFQTYDISQLMRRPFDKALYQVDMFFVKKSSKLLESKSWN